MLKAIRQSMLADKLIEQIEHMNSVDHLLFTRLDRRSAEARLVVRALKALKTRRSSTRGASK